MPLYAPLKLLVNERATYNLLSLKSSLQGTDDNRCVPECYQKASRFVSMLN